MKEWLKEYWTRFWIDLTPLLSALSVLIAEVTVIGAVSWGCGLVISVPLGMWFGVEGEKVVWSVVGVGILLTWAHWTVDVLRGGR